MIAEVKNLAMNKGNSVNFNVQFVNQDKDIIVFEDNAIVYFTVKENFYANEYIFQKTSLDGITYDSLNQKYIIKIDCEDTEELDYKDYAYDVTVVRNSGSGSSNLKEKTTVLIGDFTISKVTTFKDNEVVK